MTGSESPLPTRIGRRDPGWIELEWPDGSRDRHSAAALRRACPCARCVDETTGVRTLRPETVPDDLEHTHVELVGRYALGITFSDGHKTGIFTWTYLREGIGPDGPLEPGSPSSF